MTQKPVIYDGDMGGDDLWAIAMLLAHRDQFNILGISTVFGNVSQPQATRNAQNFLHWLGEKDIPVVQGADMPCDGMRPFGDDAYGENGVGGYILPESPDPVMKVDMADWFAGKISRQSAKTTIIATGPATNLALSIDKYPEMIDKIEEIIFMGGALDSRGKDGLPVYVENGERRIGNITLHSEFNAYQDPKALNMLLESGAPITFMAADATQFMVLTPERQKQIIGLDETYGPAFHRMLMAVDELDRTKFGVTGPFIHDPNVITYALDRTLYESRWLPKVSFMESNPHGAMGDRRGQTILGDSFANASWVYAIPDQEKVFELMVSSLKTTIGRAPSNQAHLAR